MFRRTAYMVFALLTVIIAMQAKAQDSFGFAYYDIDKLYDTVPSVFYNDEAYTPQGRLKWNAERYRRKVEAAAAIIDSMAMPVTALFGAENEQVVRDIVSCCKRDYSYIHRTSDRLDGLDFALLYYGDLIMPLRTYSGRNHLLVETRTADGKAVAIILSKRAANIDDLTAEILEADETATIIVAGEFDGTNLEPFGIIDMFCGEEAAGRGNVLYREGWRAADRIAVTAGRCGRIGIYARRWLLDSRGAPKPTYNRDTYIGGAGGRLPVWCEIKFVK